MYQAIQDVIDARVHAQADVVMDSVALGALKNALYHETSATSVTAVVSGQDLFVSVISGGERYQSHVVLAKTAP